MLSKWVWSHCVWILSWREFTGTKRGNVLACTNQSDGIVLGSHLRENMLLSVYQHCIKYECHKNFLWSHLKWSLRMTSVAILYMPMSDLTVNIYISDYVCLWKTLLAVIIICSYMLWVKWNMWLLLSWHLGHTTFVSGWRVSSTD